MGLAVVQLAALGGGASFDSLAWKRVAPVSRTRESGALMAKACAASASACFRLPVAHCIHTLACRHQVVSSFVKLPSLALIFSSLLAVVSKSQS